LPILHLTPCGNRYKLSEQNALSNEIVEAMKNVSLTNEVDAADLDAEFEELQQGDLDRQILAMNTMPDAAAVDQMPTVPTAERRFCFFSFSSYYMVADGLAKKRLAKPPGRRTETRRPITYI
jgi:glutamate synthase domain-containing protein 1